MLISAEVRVKARAMSAAKYRAKIAQDVALRRAYLDKDAARKRAVRESRPKNAPGIYHEFLAQDAARQSAIREARQKDAPEINRDFLAHEAARRKVARDLHQKVESDFIPDLDPSDEILSVADLFPSDDPPFRRNGFPPVLTDEIQREAVLGMQESLSDKQLTLLVCACCGTRHFPADMRPNNYIVGGPSWERLRDLLRIPEDGFYDKSVFHDMFSWEGHEREVDLRFMMLDQDGVVVAKVKVLSPVPDSPSDKSGSVKKPVRHRRTEYEGYTLQACKKCARDLDGKNSHRPPLALSNGLFRGVREAHAIFNLPKLTALEEVVLGLVKWEGFLVKLKPYFDRDFPGSLKLKGHCVAFAQDNSAILKEFPCHQRDLVGVVSVVFVGHIAPCANALKRFFEVRVDVLLKWIAFLQVHNPLYHPDAVGYNIENLESYKDNVDGGVFLTFIDLS
jgi:hypothetical protein